MTRPTDIQSLVLIQDKQLPVVYSRSIAVISNFVITHDTKVIILDLLSSSGDRFPYGDLGRHIQQELLKSSQLLQDEYLGRLNKVLGSISYLSSDSLVDLLEQLKSLKSEGSLAGIGQVVVNGMNKWYHQNISAGKRAMEYLRIMMMLKEISANTTTQIIMTDNEYVGAQSVMAS
ncbi:hypothetical protein DASC09_026600 [Saccharomycopsis crataegensis]|uniref:Uncharacterized protein n=1 Tax=Saccharomycopsis crataegensis TaxID=43959 RepID=A0AAV5QK45_9ASCO|nr:hypothetical protein DASC09_026600 [Saccharomycopsis crataegensis]